MAPGTTDEVAGIFKAVGPRAAYQVALRSGGHSPNPGFSSTDHGFTIDLRGLDKIALHGRASDLVSVGTGALWADVYKALEAVNRTAVGARVASVGVGGFITGDKISSNSITVYSTLTCQQGGLSFFSPRYGFSCDSVRNMQVVLANGSIIDANATSNPNLFRALKGGQSNFEIVTRFDLISYSQTEFWGGAIQYP